MNNKIHRLILLVFGLVFLFFSCVKKKETSEKDTNKEEPNIVNIVNFIRLLEPRDESITEDVLYNTVVKQVELMQKYNLKGTFLLQYDALMDERYQGLLNGLSRDSIEIGAWWEIPQPLVEKAGMEWRGRYPWDWHPNIGFSTGYTPEEREKLVDVYMADFKKAFGVYPKSVASWFIDAHTLNYMVEKYHIVASANCKDQYGTDGYTLWGGYWNQAYYPSKLNSYMPAQNSENQIDVPIFRMLGSDPVRQYDTGLESDRQGVITLEPVYNEAGGDNDWVNWYLQEFINGESMEFAYTQAGQENSFTWDAMKNGLQIQFPLIADLRDQNKLKVETLAETGKWFKEKYEVTPATSVTVTNDLKKSNHKTVWFNSRFYRLNLLWEDGTLRFRDIHLFDEKVESPYLTKKLESNQASFFTLPIVDGYIWSTNSNLAGLRFNVMKDGIKYPMLGGDPVVNNQEKGKLHVSWPLDSGEGELIMNIDEKNIEIKIEGDDSLEWFLDLTAAVKKEKLPFKNIEKNKIKCEFQGTGYSITALKGLFSVPEEDLIFRITPENNNIKLNFSERE